MVLSLKTSVYMAIGYRANQVNLLPDLDPQIEDELQNILNQIAAIRTELSVNLVQSAQVSKLDTINIDAHKGKKYLKSEGSRLLERLSVMIDVPIVFNEFKQVMPLSVYKPR